MRSVEELEAQCDGCKKVTSLGQTRRCLTCKALMCGECMDREHKTCEVCRGK